jgi:ribonuclease BN (tRNA processing enzyme)/DNA-binding response OmpR family regulator
MSLHIRDASSAGLRVRCNTLIYSVILSPALSGGSNGLRGSLLISHTHWDHIQGIPFFDPLFARGAEWDIYGPKGPGAALREALAGQMQYDYFPVTLDEFGARIRFHDLVEGSFDIEDFKVSARYLNHPALTLAYRLEVDGASIVYACDHEPHARMLAMGDGELTGEDRRHAEFVAGADLLIHDAQYTAEEYPAKIGWGHSPIEYVVRLGREAGVKRIALTHHDPCRDDEAIDRMVQSNRERAGAMDVFAAFEGQIVHVGAPGAKTVRRRTREVHAEAAVAPEPGERSVLLAVADAEASSTLSAALRAEGIRCDAFSSAERARTLIARERPWLTVIEHDPPRIEGMDMCRAIRSRTGEGDAALPILMVAGEPDQQAGGAAGVTDWLIKPFSVAHARTKIREWVLRTARRPAACGAANGRATAPATQACDAGEARGFGEAASAPGTEMNRRRPEMIPDVDKSGLLWMFGREIASFDNPVFSSNVGKIIARAQTAPQNGAGRTPSTRRFAGRGG